MISNPERDVFIDYCVCCILFLYALLIAYRIAGKFGGELNLAVWQYAFKPPNFFPRTCTYGDTVPYRQIYVLNSVKNVIWGPNCQYFRLYGIKIFISMLNTIMDFAANSRFSLKLFNQLHVEADSISHEILFMILR